LVHAEITFKELARQTGLGEKTLHRMLNRRGNPTARNLGVIVKSIINRFCCLSIRNPPPLTRLRRDDPAAGTAAEELPPAGELYERGKQA
jgi:hypothetical protein